MIDLRRSARDPRPRDPARRRFIRGVSRYSVLSAAGSATAGGLVGCGSDDDGSTAVSPQGPSPAPTPSPAPSPSPTPPAPTPPAPVPPAVAFVHGVASGDPLQDRVILWTRVSVSGTPRATAVALRWQIASDTAFSSIVASGTASTDAATDFTVHVDAAGLAAGARYYYRFIAAEVVSPVGRTRTLPASPANRIRLAAFSCANFPAGFFNVYADAASAPDIDFALHLGDYLYEDGRGGYASEDAQAIGRLAEPPGETLTLAQYRARYAQYRTDADLQALHAAMPMIAVWDDHEFADDAWRDGALNHDETSEGAFTARKAAAMQAWREWLPVRVPDPTDPARIWRSFDFGGLMSLHMLDTRIYGRDRQLRAGDFVVNGALDAPRLAAARNDPGRQLLGAAQLQWLLQQLATSGATWQVLGQQVLMAPLNLPAPLVTSQVGIGRYLELLARYEVAPQTLDAAERALVEQPSIPYNLDAWDGYAATRNAVLDASQAAGTNLVSLAGDTHNAWASDLRDTRGNATGVEFGIASVTSPGFERLFPDVDPDVFAALASRVSDTLVYAETGSRGYLVLTVTPASIEGEYRTVRTVLEPGVVAIADRTLHVLPGAANRRLIDGAAATAVSAGAPRRDAASAVPI